MKIVFLFFCSIALLLNGFAYAPTAKPSNQATGEFAHPPRDWNNLQPFATPLSYPEIEKWFRNNPEKIEALKTGTLLEEQTPAFWDPSLTIQYTVEFGVLSVINERENKGWSEIEIAALAYWNVMNGRLHFMLDMAGMAPVVGEVADLINGAWYYVEGNETEAALSIVAAVPIAGWFAKGIITFGNPNQLAKVLNISGKNLHAHHIIPWQLFDNPVVQKAAEKGFHMNDAVNGIALKKYTKMLEDGIHAKHPAYTGFVQKQLEAYSKKQSSILNVDEAKVFLEETLIPLLRKHIDRANKSGLTLNEYFKKLN